MSILSMGGFLFLSRWMHIFFGVTWIGLLYYFNFVQGAFFNETDAATKSNATQKLVPRALWWFRWAAMFTLITGILMLGGYAHYVPGYFSTSRGFLISLGATLGAFMWANVWFVIWPNQKVVIANAVDTAAGKPANPQAAACGARALVASRTNVVFSMAMLFFMAAANHLPLAINPDTSKATLMAAFFVVLGLLEVNALKGKVGPMASVRGVIHIGVAYTALLYLLVEFLTR